MAAQLLNLLLLCARPRWRSQRPTAQEAIAARERIRTPSLVDPSMGYCATTATVDYQSSLRRGCQLGSSGSWSARENGVNSLGECAALCQRCPRCAWVSFSLAHDDCSWYHNCTLPLQLKWEGRSFRTAFLGRRVNSK